MSKKATFFSIRIVIAAVVAALLLGYGATYFSQQKRIREADENIAALKSELKELQMQEAAMESDLAFSKTDAYIERLARQELGFVKEGEIKFVEMPAEEE